MNYYIKCNGDYILVDAHPTHPRLCAAWGAEQCEGCGVDIIESGTVVKEHGRFVRVRCNCGATYPILSKDDRSDTLD